MQKTTFGPLISDKSKRGAIFEEIVIATIKPTEQCVYSIMEKRSAWIKGRRLITRANSRPLNISSSLAFHYFKIAGTCEKITIWVIQEENNVNVNLILFFYAISILLHILKCRKHIYWHCFSSGITSRILNFVEIKFKVVFSTIDYVK